MPAAAARNDGVPFCARRKSGRGTVRTSGGAIPSRRLADGQGLGNFLEKELGVLTYAVEAALLELGQKGSVSILNVRLSLRRAKSLKLAA